MKVIVIGGKGHIGTYLCPMLIENGFEVICITRGKSKPYEDNPLWEKVQCVNLDRENEVDFEKKIAEYNAEIIIDLINFKLESTKKIVSALKETKNLKLYLFCSSIWAHGLAKTIPLDPNDDKKEPICDYGKQKFQCEMYLREEFKVNKFPVIIIEPGQISGPGWKIINPWGNLNLKIFQEISKGNEIILPNLGMDTLHHIHGCDVAQCFLKAILNKEKAMGEIFNAVSENSITTYGYAKHLFEYFKKEPKIKYVGWKEFEEYLGSKEEARFCYLHLARSGSFSIEKEKKLLGYVPKYTNVETIDFAVGDYVKKGLI